MLAFWITAIAWIFPSYLLHAALHELAHYTIARQNSLEVTRLHLFPPTRWNGHFVFAYVEVPQLPIAPLRTRLEFFWAPLWAESLAWAIIAALIVAIRNPTGVAAGLLVVELISPLVDSLWWLLGWWTDRRGTDAWQIRRMKDWSLTHVRLISLLWLIPAALTAALLCYTL